MKKGPHREVGAKSAEAKGPAVVSAAPEGGAGV